MHREALRFPRACIATPHYLASAAGADVLASGGNAVDAAVAASLTLGVVTPFLSGYGGDLFALVWRDGAPHGYLSGGRAPSGATLDAVRERAGADAIPKRGALSVTVPGAVRGWFDLLDRFGSRPFADLARRPLAYARDGVPLTARGRAVFAFLEPMYEEFPEWRAVYAGTSERGVLSQPDLARTIDALIEGGPEPYYRGVIAEATASYVQEQGGLLTAADLAAYEGEWAAPLSASYRDVEVLELPPPTQGVGALEALRIVDALGPLPDDGVERQHLLIESAKWALSDLNAHVTDPAAMAIDPRQLISDEWIADRGGRVERDRAGAPPFGTRLFGGTAYLCAADADGTVVSLIQTNFNEFGSGLTVPGWGINLTNRGKSFSLDPDHANVIGPGKRTLHTLIPALALREGKPWLAFGTMGSDGQAQTHLQVLTRIVDDGADLQAAIDAPRWRVDPADWTVRAESRLGPDVVDGLASRGHDISLVGKWWDHAGYVEAIACDPAGFAGASDPRSEGAVLGF